MSTSRTSMQTGPFLRRVGADGGAAASPPVGRQACRVGVHRRRTATATFGVMLLLAGLAASAGPAVTEDGKTALDEAECERQAALVSPLAKHATLADELASTDLLQFGRVLEAGNGSLLIEIPGTPEAVWPRVETTLRFAGWARQPSAIGPLLEEGEVRMAVFTRGVNRLSASLVCGKGELTSRVLLRRSAPDG